MKIQIHRFLFFLLLTSCATGSKDLVAIDSAVTDVQSGRAEQGRAALAHECEHGASGACALTGAKVMAVRPLSVMQSVTSNAQSRFVVVAPSRVKLNYYMKHGDAVTKLAFERVEIAGTAAACDQVEAFGLEPRTGYELLIVGPDGTLWDKRGFRALDLTRRRARLAVVNAFDESSRLDAEKLWTQLLNQRPDVILVVGNGLLPSAASASTAEDLRSRYVETRDSLALFKTGNLIPLLAVWNDLEYGRHDGDRTNPIKTDAMDTFFAFYAQKKTGPGFERGPGASAWWDAFGLGFALLDNRSFRSPNGLDVSDQTHFGSEQEQWLMDHLKASPNPTVLVSGDPFFASTLPLESFEGDHPKRFARILEEWKKDPEPMVFLSGDRQRSEVTKIPAARLGYPTYEATSSGIKASSAKGGDMNYLMVELIRAERNFIQLDVQAFGRDQKQLYQKTLTVKHQ